MNKAAVVFSGMLYQSRQTEQQINQCGSLGQHNIGTTTIPFFKCSFKILYRPVWLGLGKMGSFFAKP